MSIARNAQTVVNLLKQHNLKVAFAESCTGGLVAGALTKIPGVSQFHCGGVVTYRNETKTAYLNIPPDVLDDPGPVSAVVAELMAKGVLAQTPEADVTASVTGHLGPGAPPAQDGLVYIGFARRGLAELAIAAAEVQVREFWCDKSLDRHGRQQQAIAAVLEFLSSNIAAPE